MEDLPLCWMIEYASSIGRDDVVQCLFSDFTDIPNFTDDNNLCFKNAKGRFIVRSILGKIQTDSNPKLEQEISLLGYLLSKYGSPSSREETIALMIDVHTQSYMHYIRNLKDADGVDEKAHCLSILKKFHKKKIDHHKEKEMEFEMDDEERNDEIDDEDVPMPLTKVLLPNEKELINQMGRIISSYRSSDIRNPDIDDLIFKHPYESFKAELSTFLIDINSRLPLTFLEQFKEVYTGGVTNLFPKNISITNLINSTSSSKITKIHGLKSKYVKRFIAENELSDLLEDGEDEDEDEDEEEEVIQTSQSRTPKTSTYHNFNSRRASVGSSSPISFEVESQPNESITTLPNETMDSSNDEAQTWCDSEDELNELLKAAESQDSPSPRSQPPTQVIATPVVATQLRDSVKDLARLRGSDPFDRTQQESRNAMRRPEPENPPPRKIRRTTISWDSDSEMEELEEINYREPRRIVELNNVLESENQPPEPLRPERPVIHVATARNPTGYTLPPPPKQPAAPTRYRHTKLRKKWTNEEVDHLVEGIRLFGVGNWKSILDHFPFEGRTGTNLKDKYRNLLKHYSAEQILGQDFAGEKQ